MKNTECVKVIIRCRPLSRQEEEDGRKMIVQMEMKLGQITVRNPKIPDESPKSFTFDQIFDPGTKQETIYNDTASPIVESCLEGYNGTIFAYGQTGTGKTFTMEGKESPPALKGIIPRTFEHVFKRIESMSHNKQFLVSASFLELYNEEIRDLLSKNYKNKLEIREKPEAGPYVKDLSKFIVKNPQELADKLVMGSENRSVGATNMNLDSSRSHSLFMITIEQTETTDGQEHIRVGKLNLVDLAGSERQTKTQATGDRFKEAININQSLTTLGNVISALIDNKAQHIPYRDSKLTRLLQDSLGGNTKTVMVANIGPADYNYDETISTLRYAHRAKQIKNKPKINEDPKDAMLRQFQEEIQKLRQQLEGAASGSDPSGILGEGETQIIEVQKVVKVQNQDKIREMEARLEIEKEQVRKRIEEERKRIEQLKNLAEEDKIKLYKNLEEKEEQAQAQREMQQKLIKKIQKMEEKLVQGQSEVEQAMMKEKELHNAKQALEEQKAYQQQLSEELEKKEEEMMKLQTKYHSQKDEVEDKTKRIKQIVQRIKQIENENKELDEFYAREIEGLQERRRQVTQEVKLKQLILEYFIPPKELERMQMLSTYNEEKDEWIIQGLELTGNMVKNNPQEQDQELVQQQEQTMQAIAELSNHPNVYFVYTEDGLVREEELAPQEKQKAQQRAKSAKKPMSAKKRPGSKQTRLQSSKKTDQSRISQSTATSEQSNFPKAKGLVPKK